ncbi:MAG: hypothetical protein Ta2F_07830 [Termitinemataceae bacterium]|nr:MAG: hypothetical protein Ta2F_07830 [Termitinemataceae bacterium]
MADLNDPYQSPASEAQPVNQTVQGSLLTEQALLYLKDASPWMRFIAIMGFIGCGLMIVLGLAAVISGSEVESGVKEISGIAGEISDGSNSNLFLSFIEVFSGLAGLIYLASAVLYFFPALFTWKTGIKIRNFTQSNSPAELENAFRNNKSFWKFNGILLIVCIALIPVTLIVLVIVAASGLTG